jgi:hypothetical protein
MEILAIVMSSLALLAAAYNAMNNVRERKRNQKQNTALLKHTELLIKPVAEKVANLEKGIVPDFEKAREAANAVNEFNDGITGILGFDPHEALKKLRSDNFGGEHV